MRQHIRFGMSGSDPLSTTGLSLGIHWRHLLPPRAMIGWRAQAESANISHALANKLGQNRPTVPFKIGHVPLENSPETETQTETRLRASANVRETRLMWANYIKSWTNYMKSLRTRRHVVVKSDWLIDWWTRTSGSEEGCSEYEKRQTTHPGDPEYTTWKWHDVNWKLTCLFVSNDIS